MIIDAVCKKCKKKLGYVSMFGDLTNQRTMCYFSGIEGKYLRIELLCDECGNGIIVLDKGDEDDN